MPSLGPWSMGTAQKRRTSCGLCVGHEQGCMQCCGNMCRASLVVMRVQVLRAH